MSTLKLLAFHPTSTRGAGALLGMLFVVISCQNAKAAGNHLELPSQTLYLSATERFVPAIETGVQSANVASPLIANWVTQIMNKLETWLTNRTHMIQFCAIGMVLALFIIWWRKT